MSKPIELEVDVDGEFFVAGYLTLISVIQATAFGFFVYTLADILKNDNFYNQLPFLVCQYFTIINVTYGYFGGTRDLRWHFGALDILLVFTLGLSECLAILVLEKGRQSEALWFKCYLLLFFVALLAIWDGSRKLKKYKNLYPSTSIKDHSHNLYIFGTICLLMILIFATLVTLIQLGQLSRYSQELIAWVMSFAMIGVFYLIYRLDKKKRLLP